MKKIRKSFVIIITAINFILGLNDSSDATSSYDTEKKSPKPELSKMGKREKYCFVFEAQFLDGHGP